MADLPTQLGEEARKLRPSLAVGGRVTRQLKAAGYDVDGVQEALDSYTDIDRDDYESGPDGADEYREARSEAWGEFVDQVDSAEREEEEDGVEGPPGLATAEWSSGAFGSPGFLTDPGRARSTSCIRLELGEGHAPLVYSKGIVGALDEEQQALYCQEGYVDRAITEAQRQRLQAMATAAHECSVEAKAAEPQEHMAAYFSCLGRELKAKGVEA